MKTAKLSILLVFAWNLWAILPSTVLLADENAKGPTDVGVATNDGEIEQLQSRIRSLERSIAGLDERLRIQRDKRGMPGLRASLAGLHVIPIHIEDLPLEAIRYGLTEKNIRRTVESELKEHNIRTINRDSDSSELSAKDLRHILFAAHEPEIHVEVQFGTLREGLYIGAVIVSIEKNNPPIIPLLDKVWQTRSEGMKETIRAGSRTTEWQFRCDLFGKQEDFAEDEKNSLQELLGQFIQYHLEANPKGHVGYIGPRESGTNRNRSVMIGTKYVHRGDVVDGVTVVMVYGDRVVFEKNGRQWAQRVGDTPDPAWQQK